MHELSIASSVIDAVRAELSARPRMRARVVGLRIGELAGVDADSLRFGFETLVKDTDLDGLALDIENVSRVQACDDCAHEFAVDRYTLECPACGSLRTACRAGDELDIKFIEMEEVA